MIDKADIQMLPAVYLEVCNDFNAGPSALGLVTFWRGLTQSLVALAAGPLGGRYDRVRLVSFGCFFWGVASALVGASGSIGSLLVARALNGLGIGLVVPLVFALVADLAPEHLRGRAFGILNFASGIGGAIGGFGATELASASTEGGIPGWRLSFYIIAVVSCVMALVLAAFGGEDPRLRARASQAAAPITLKSVAADALSVLKVKTFVIILLQGAFGSAPWYSMGFLTLYFELHGLAHHAAALTRSLLDIGASLGTLLGGFLNDFAARISPNHGRVTVAQVSVGSGLPLFVLIFYALPASAAGPVLFIAGLTISWCQGVNNSIMAEVTMPHLRPTIYGLDRMLEGILSPAAGFIAGWLAESVFGFRDSGGCGSGEGLAPNASAAVTNSTISSGVEGLDGNAAALRSALAVTMLVPWTVCFFAYTGLHCTYPGDRRRFLAIVPSTAQTAGSSSGPPGEDGDDSVAPVGVSLVENDAARQDSWVLDKQAVEQK